MCGEWATWVDQKIAKTGYFWSANGGIAINNNTSAVMVEGTVIYPITQDNKIGSAFPGKNFPAVYLNIIKNSGGASTERCTPRKSNSAGIMNKVAIVDPIACHT